MLTLSGSTVTAISSNSLRSFTCNRFKRVMPVMVEIGRIFKSSVIINATIYFMYPAKLSEFKKGADER